MAIRCIRPVKTFSLVVLGLAILQVYSESNSSAQEFVITPIAEEVSLPSVVNSDEEANSITCPKSNVADPVCTHLVELRKEIGPVEALPEPYLAANGQRSGADNPSSHKDFAGALQELVQSKGASCAPWLCGDMLTGSQIDDVRQATTLHYAVNSLEQIALLLDQADLTSQAVQTRALADTVRLDLTLPVENGDDEARATGPRLAAPTGATLTR